MVTTVVVTDVTILAVVSYITFLNFERGENICQKIEDADAASDLVTIAAG